uniref:Uncharacterized protein n=1 Tax=Spermophilus dauricus TaxID=99837 RepID=A0A8C9QJS2_SPEDA
MAKHQEAWKPYLIISNSSIKIKIDPICGVYRKLHFLSSYKSKKEEIKNTSVIIIFLTF